MDNVSIVKNTVSHVELLANSSFDDSNTSITGWEQWCSSYCHYVISEIVISGADCYLQDGNCCTNRCLDPAIDLLGQFFSDYTQFKSYYIISIIITRDM
jgi:hypothetical protein